MADPVKCANCMDEITEITPTCVLEAVASVLVERGFDEAKVMQVIADTDVDHFWKSIGPLIDELEEKVVAKEL